jgi:hypothetical protein
MATARYKVSVCIAPGIPGYESSPPSIDHVFTCRTDAIRFAKAVSRYFVKPDPSIRQGLVSMWCLVYALPVVAWRESARVFTCIDPGGIVLWDRSDEIPDGFYGAPRKRETHADAA